MKYKVTTSLILALAALLGPMAFAAGIVLSVNIAPPQIADYSQPPCPADGYIWTPGYYQYGEYGYYWVPGAWVIPPAPGDLWTPGYWAFVGGKYNWHAGYWGPQVGFYGGINYGNGYFGSGFTGGRWEGNVFKHNTAIAKVDTTKVHNVYEDKTVVRNVSTPNHAFNGRGGITAKPTREETAAGSAPHREATPAQAAHAEEAHNNHLAAHGAPRGR